MQRCVGR